MRKPADPRFATPLFALLLMAFAVPAQAQTGYLFKPPAATFSLRLGAAGPRASDDLFSFFTQQLTLSRSDFRAFSIGGDIAVRVDDRFDVVGGVAIDRSFNRSEFRDWVDQDDQPIEQTTEFARIPLTLSGKFYLIPRGRTLAQHAWVPNRFTPYLLAGAGYMFYNLKQEGDFVDAETRAIFSRTFKSDSGGTTAHVGGGAEWWVTPKLGLDAEGRYSWASGQLDPDFSDFGQIDLDGFQVTAGLSVRF